MKKVTGIGGIFFKCSDPNQTKNWYRDHLGLETDTWGTNFEWRQTENPDKKGFMVNYRVDNLEALASELREAGVEILDEIESLPYGKFLHIMDCDGVKVELWEPNDEAYEEIVEGRTF